ncbi:hypothetical protein Q0F98_11420 [Paenibacillus amylolyticus]|nr:hypothetical protein Q0F98_11420 [Paenibacillus amylolyticus]
MERVLFICESKGNEVIRLPYDSFGRNSTPYWYYQVLEACAPIDRWEVCKESLIQAVYKWETHDYMLPPQDYACGAAAMPLLLLLCSQEDMTLNKRQLYFAIMPNQDWILPLMLQDLSICPFKWTRS